ncbi:hypothetical protein D3C86_2057140 [compost metagenome]
MPDAVTGTIWIAWVVDQPSRVESAETGLERSAVSVENFRVPSEARAARALGRTALEPLSR